MKINVFEPNNYENTVKPVVFHDSEGAQKGAKGSQKGSKREPKGTKGSKSEPKGGQNAYKNRPSEQVAKKEPKREHRVR